MDLFFERLEEIFDEVSLFHRFVEDVSPTELQPRISYGAGVTEQQYLGHFGEVEAHPAEQKVGPYILDQTPPHQVFTVEAIRPGIPQAPRENGPGRVEIFFLPECRRASNIACGGSSCRYLPCPDGTARRYNGTRSGG